MLRQSKLALKKSKRIDYYAVLEVESDAGEDAIKRAYRKAALKHHPDKVRCSAVVAAAGCSCLAPAAAAAWPALPLPGACAVAGCWLLAAAAGCPVHRIGAADALLSGWRLLMPGCPYAPSPLVCPARAGWGGRPGGSRGKVQAGGRGQLCAVRPPAAAALRRRVELGRDPAGVQQ